MERKRLQVLYNGHVQGVGFRYTVKALAPGFEVTGTIRKLADGSLELTAEGPRDELKAFQAAVRDQLLIGGTGAERQIGARRRLWLRRGPREDGILRRQRGFRIRYG